MIPDIGIIIGTYVIVRMVSFLTRSQESWIVRVLSLLGIIIVLISLADILLRN